MFMGGHGVAQSNAEAAKWYRKAAIQGHVEAQGKLGAMFLQEGCGVALSEKHVFH
jgi:TPR repeat protein